MFKIDEFFKNWSSNVDNSEKPDIYPIFVGDSSPSCKPVESSSDGTVTLSVSFDHNLYAKNNPHEVQKDAS